jgi:hypothetical protein
MPRLRILSIPVALLIAVSPASAQYRGGAAPTSGASHAGAAAVRQAAGGSWNGTASKWGGSPVQRQVERRERRERLVYVLPFATYMPVAVTAPAPIAVTYVVDTVYAAAPPVQMQIVTSGHEPRELTTLEVYRLQPRFQKYRQP